MRKSLLASTQTQGINRPILTPSRPNYCLIALFIVLLSIICLFIGVMVFGSPATPPPPSPTPNPPPSFQVAGASIASCLNALATNEISCVDFIQAHLDRIDMLDQSGPQLNSIISDRRDQALLEAALLDQRFQTTGSLVGALHCLPIVAKDDYDFVGLATTSGSTVFQNCFPQHSSPILDQLISQGAIMLAKTNLPDFTVGNAPVMSSVSTMIGATKNAFVATRSPYGSSGGTGAAIAASLGVIGLGADTQGSIQLPAAVEGMVGIRPTHDLNNSKGLTSAAYGFPLVVPQDSNGPIGRTVADVATVLQFIVDPGVVQAHQINTSYTAFLIPTGLQGAKIGFSRDTIESFGQGLFPDPEVVNAANATIADMMKAGATVKTVNIVGQVSAILLNASNTSECGGSWNRKGITDYFATSPMPDCPVKSIQDIINSGVYPVGDATRTWLDNMVNASLPPEVPCGSYDAAKATAQKLILDTFAANDIDFIMYPTLTALPTLLVPNNTYFNLPITFMSASTGLPSVTFPVAYGFDGIPIGMSITGRSYSEAELIKLVFGYEVTTFNARRQQPKDYPPL